MLDCGMHMGFTDEVIALNYVECLGIISLDLYLIVYILRSQRKFPDFSVITNNKMTLTEYLDCVIISHFHLDHCGALPFMTEMIGYKGPIYMTHPTKAICPILLVSYNFILLELSNVKLVIILLICRKT